MTAIAYRLDLMANALACAKAALRAKVTYDGGRRYASRSEATRGAQLEILQAAGQIRGLEFQPRVDLHAGIFYKPDFKYYELQRLPLTQALRLDEWVPVWEDVKGIIARDTALKLRLWRVHGPGLLRLTRQSGTRFRVIREIRPKGPRYAD